ncbi:hypothetical protein L1987_26547 [Smallanthus sonchifolius]|uniref:Uncharacterized protein n=1 Tax=Smallanthus sonchifolius TaxID=185202 RepID=A0ACB9I9U6_9ASTR|nr:hypothetical protein L1987_26547 [Smallanthus sonchifolius]
MKKAEETSGTRVTRRFVAENRDGKEAPPIRRRHPGVLGGKERPILSSSVGGKSFRDALVSDPIPIPQEKVIIVPSSTKALTSLFGRALVGRSVDFNTLRTFYFLAREVGVLDMFPNSTIGAEILGSDREDGEVGEDQAVDPRNCQSSCMGTKEGVNAAGSNLEGRVYFFNSLDHSNLNGPSPRAQGKKAQPMDSFLAHRRPRKRQRSDDPFDLNDIIGIVQTPASVSASDPVSRSMDLNSQPLPDPVQEGATVVVTRDESVEDQDHGGGHLVSSGLDREVQDTIELGSLIGANLHNFRDEVRSFILGEGFNDVSS